jgi:hypothetical protein
MAPGAGLRTVLGEESGWAPGGVRPHAPLIRRLVCGLAGLLVLATAPGVHADRPRDLSGIWEVTITGGLTGSSLLCRIVPALNMTEVDTVFAARSLEELVYAVIPDSSIAWFDAVCDPVFSGGAGDTVSGSCRIPLVYANPCTLVGDITFDGALEGDHAFAADADGEVTLGGPGICPKTTCPCELKIMAQRIGDLPLGPIGAPGLGDGP